MIYLLLEAMSALILLGFWLILIVDGKYLLVETQAGIGPKEASARMQDHLEETENKGTIICIFI